MGNGITSRSRLRQLAASAAARDTRAREALDLIVAEMGAAGVEPRPLNVLHFALEHGADARLADDIAALLEQRGKEARHGT